MEIATIEAILEGIKLAPSLIGSAETLIGMFKQGQISEDQLSSIWTSITQSVRDAEAKWKAAGQS